MPMRYGIFADVHSNLEALEAVIHAYKNEAIDKYLCVGDVVGYGANPQECVDQVKMLAMITVAGNHDWASVGLFSVDYFNPVAKEAIFWTKNNLDNASRYFLESLGLVYKNEYLTLVHGTLNNPQEFNYISDNYAVEETFRLLETRLCFVGHSHVAGIVCRDEDGCTFYHGLFYPGVFPPKIDNSDINIEIQENNRYIVNVGSVGQPRDGNPGAAYCVYDTAKREVRIKRIGYDIKAAREKIFAAGLPVFLGNRLTDGR